MQAAATTGQARGCDTDEAQKTEQQIHFMKNLSMFGAMLFIMANGAGAWSIDRCCGCDKQT